MEQLKELRYIGAYTMGYIAIIRNVVAVIISHQLSE